MKCIFWRRVVLCVVFILTALTCCQPGAAQQTLGSINGTVVDPSGAAVPNATVTATDPSIGVKRTTSTQSNGFYQLFNLPVGTYTVQVTHAGFDTTTVKGVAVREASASTVNPSLKVGQASESVEVTANPLLNATDA